MGVDADDAKRAVKAWNDAVGSGGKRAVGALAVMAEDAMKAEAPEGSGFEPPSLRDSIDTVPDGPSDKKTVQPFKRTRKGWLLVHAVVGNPRAPRYNRKRPPAEPLIDWAEAKLGDPGLGWYLQDKIFREGQKTFPNRFVDRSIKQWEAEAEDVAGKAVRDALRGGP